MVRMVKLTNVLLDVPGISPAWLTGQEKILWGVELVFVPGTVLHNLTWIAASQPRSLEDINDKYANPVFALCSQILLDINAYIQ